MILIYTISLFCRPSLVLILTKQAIFFQSLCEHPPPSIPMFLSNTWMLLLQQILINVWRKNIQTKSKLLQNFLCYAIWMHLQRYGSNSFLKFCQHHPGSTEHTSNRVDPHCVLLHCCYFNGWALSNTHLVWQRSSHKCHMAITPAKDGPRSNPKK